MHLTKLIVGQQHCVNVISQHVRMLTDRGRVGLGPERNSGGDSEIPSSDGFLECVQLNATL